MTEGVTARLPAVQKRRVWFSLKVLLHQLAGTGDSLRCRLLRHCALGPACDRSYFDVIFRVLPLGHLPARRHGRSAAQVGSRHTRTVAVLTGSRFSAPRGALSRCAGDWGGGRLRREALRAFPEAPAAADEAQEESDSRSENADLEAGAQTSAPGERRNAHSSSSPQLQHQRQASPEAAAQRGSSRPRRWQSAFARALPLLSGAAVVGVEMQALHSGGTGAAPGVTSP